MTKTLRVIDYLIARDVLEYPLMTKGQVATDQLARGEKNIGVGPIPFFSSDREMAFIVVDKLVGEDWRFALHRSEGTNGLWVAEFGWASYEHPKLSTAICGAALKAKMVDFAKEGIVLP